MKIHNVAHKKKMQQCALRLPDKNESCYQAESSISANLWDKKAFITVHMLRKVEQMTEESTLILSGGFSDRQETLVTIRR